MHSLCLPLDDNQPCIDSVSLVSAADGPVRAYFNQVKIKPLNCFPKLDKTIPLIKRMVGATLQMYVHRPVRVGDLRVGDVRVEIFLQLIQPSDGWYAARWWDMYRVVGAMAG